MAMLASGMTKVARMPSVWVAPVSYTHLDVYKRQIFALLGPNGAGKTTLISIICGIVNASTGSVVADGHDIVRDYRAARAQIGLVPQELSTDAFESVWVTVKFSRGLFGKPPNPAYLEKILRDLSLWDKKEDVYKRQAIPST